MNTVQLRHKFENQLGWLIYPLVHDKLIHDIAHSKVSALPRVPATRCFFRRFKVRFIVKESSIYQRVEESLLYQSPLSVNSAKFSFCRNTTKIFSVTSVGISSEKNNTTVKLRLFFVKVNSMLLWDSKNNNFRL